MFLTGHYINTHILYLTIHKYTLYHFLNPNIYQFILNTRFYYHNNTIKTYNSIIWT